MSDDSSSTVYGAVFEVDQDLRPVRFSSISLLCEKSSFTRDKSYGLILSRISASDFYWISLLKGISVKIIIGRLTPDLIAAMSDVRELEAIWFCQTPVTEALASAVQHIGGVRLIGFENCSIDEQALISLVDLPNVADVSMYGLRSVVPEVDECEIETKDGHPGTLNLAFLNHSKGLHSISVHGTRMINLGSVNKGFQSQISRVSLSFQDFESELLAKLLTPSLKSLDLTGSKTDGCTPLAALSECEQLQSLLLRDSRVFSSWAGCQVSLPQLTTLNLSGLQLTQADLEWIWSSLLLEKLDLSRNTLEIKSCKQLSGFGVLRDLKLEGLNLKSIPTTVNATTLEHLSLRQNLLADADLSALQCYRALKTLDLSFCRLELLPPLQEFGRLTELSLDASYFSPSDFRELGSLTALRLLSLGSCGVDGETLKSLAALTNLFSLTLYDNDLDCDSVQCLAGFEHLDDLDLSGNVRLSGAALGHLPISIKNLNLASTGLQDKDLSGLLRLTQLDFLDVSDTSITDQCLAALCAHPTLRQLKLDGTKITENAKSILRKSRSLQSVSAYRTALDSLNISGIKLID